MVRYVITCRNTTYRFDDVVWLTQHISDFTLRCTWSHNSTPCDISIPCHWLNPRARELLEKHLIEKVFLAKEDVVYLNTEEAMKHCVEAANEEARSSVTGD